MLSPKLIRNMFEILFSVIHNKKIYYTQKRHSYLISGKITKQRCYPLHKKTYVKLYQCVMQRLARLRLQRKPYDAPLNVLSINFFHHQTFDKQLIAT